MSSSPHAPLLVVDGDNLAHRAFHSMPRTITGDDGRPINAVVGWTSMLLALWDAERPRAVLVAWDTLDVPTYRHRLWPTYQGGRVFDPAIVAQLERLPELARAFGFGVGKQAGYEADDLMATAALAEARQGGTCLLLTTDRDAYQLVSERIVVLAPRRGQRELQRIGPGEVEALIGVPPHQVRDWKALAGDASDGIPGVPGIGPKAATALLRAHGTLEAVLAARGEAIPPEQAERARLFYRVVTPQTDAPLTLPATGEPDWSAAADWLRAEGAKGLAERVARRGQAAGQQAPLGL